MGIFAVAAHRIDCIAIELHGAIHKGFCDILTAMIHGAFEFTYVIYTAIARL
jgi:hypothetical protein